MSFSNNVAVQRLWGQARPAIKSFLPINRNSTDDCVMSPRGEWCEYLTSLYWRCVYFSFLYNLTSPKSGGLALSILVPKCWNSISTFDTCCTLLTGPILIILPHILVCTNTLEYKFNCKMSARGPRKGQWQNTQIITTFKPVSTQTHPAWWAWQSWP